jgi:hypothetical protein
VIGQNEKQKEKIDKLLASDKDRILVLVRTSGNMELKHVINQNWPENITEVYNLLRNPEGKVIYLGEFPTSQSGDWNLELLHYFSDSGQLIAFEKRLSYFNDNCGDGTVVETVVELYDADFKIVKNTKTLTDDSGKALSDKNCGNGFDWVIEKRPTAAELLELKEIRE